MISQHHRQELLHSHIPDTFPDQTHPFRIVEQSELGYRLDRPLGAFRRDKKLVQNDAERPNIRLYPNIFLIDKLPLRGVIRQSFRQLLRIWSSRRRRPNRSRRGTSSTEHSLGQRKCATGSFLTLLSDLDQISNFEVVEYFDPECAILLILGEFNNDAHRTDISM